MKPIQCGQLCEVVLISAQSTMEPIQCGPLCEVVLISALLTGIRTYTMWSTL